MTDSTIPQTVLFPDLFAKPRPPCSTSVRAQALDGVHDRLDAGLGTGEQAEDSGRGGDAGADDPLDEPQLEGGKLRLATAGPRMPRAGPTGHEMGRPEVAPKAPPRRWTSMGVALWADGTDGNLSGRCGQVGDRRRAAAMAAKVVVQPFAKMADAGRPPRRLREQRRRTWRTSRRESRRIQNGRTRPGADEVFGRLHVACVAAGALTQRGASQRLIAIPIASDRGVLLWRW